MRDKHIRDLAEGMPIYYKKTKDLKEWEKVCLYSLSIDDTIEAIPLSEMGYKFKRHHRAMTDFIVNILND
tara:strand:- start:1320 stop:1529 length:210 start_codon:yes stop_codon:yes gene_type:complete